MRLRFRSDVPVGITLSGGVDSSALLGIVGQRAPAVDAFTFVTGDSEYDELPWARRMLASTNHRSVVCSIGADDVPDLAASVQASEDEPFGGVPTLAYARLFELAERPGTGMGLATCKRLIERLGGEIWAEPGVGGGNAVRFSLPDPT